MNCGGLEKFEVWGMRMRMWAGHALPVIDGRGLAAEPPTLAAQGGLHQKSNLEPAGLPDRPSAGVWSRGRALAALPPAWPSWAAEQVPGRGPGGWHVALTWDHLLPHSAGARASGPGDSDQREAATLLRSDLLTETQPTRHSLRSPGRRVLPGHPRRHQPGRVWSASARFQHGSF